MINFGILGTGRIAHTMADAINFVDGAQVTAVGSRTSETAAKFADELNSKHNLCVTAHGSYDELCADPNTDIIYIATPHGRHYTDAMNALSHGKHVLCEKAFTLNSAEAESLIDYAETHSLFICEAMWSRFIPATQKIGEWIRSGKIGNVRIVRADCGFCAADDFTSRLLNLEAGGGALLDVGIYPLAFISFVYGGEMPHSISACGNFFDNGADSITSALLGYSSGTASFNSSLCAQISASGIIYGSTGKIIVHDTIVAPNHVTLYDSTGNAAEDFICPHEFNGYEYELRTVCESVRNGKTECTQITHAETIQTMKIIDSIKKATGLHYPQEKAD